MGVAQPPQSHDPGLLCRITLSPNRFRVSGDLEHEARRGARREGSLHTRHLVGLVRVCLVWLRSLVATPSRRQPTGDGADVPLPEVRAHHRARRGLCSLRSGHTRGGAEPLERNHTRPPREWRRERKRPQPRQAKRLSPLRSITLSRTGFMPTKSHMRQCGCSRRPIASDGSDAVSQINAACRFEVETWTPKPYW